MRDHNDLYHSHHSHLRFAPSTQADITFANAIRVLGSLQIAGMTKLTFSHTTTDLLTPRIAIEGTLRVEAPLLMVYPISDIHKRIQLLRHTSVDIESTVPANEWLRLHLLLPDCGSVSSIAIHTNDTDTWAELRGVSCARSKKSREVAIFIGLGAGCGALVILLMALRVSQWTYVVYDTSERMRRRYACAAYFFSLSFYLYLTLCLIAMSNFVSTYHCLRAPRP